VNREEAPIFVLTSCFVEKKIDIDAINRQRCYVALPTQLLTSIDVAASPQGFNLRRRNFPPTHLPLLPLAYAVRPAAIVLRNRRHNRHSRLKLPLYLHFDQLSCRLRLQLP
ncbi:hypothetical protein U1Q18_021567, partial [Sarracenia purpurea var. burkii]